MNNISICGNCTEPVLKYTQGGKAIISFSIAINRKDKNGDQTTTWVSCKAWDTLAENIAANIKKGDRLLVAGRLETEEWEKDGQKQSRTVLVADEAGISLRWAKD